MRYRAFFLFASITTLILLAGCAPQEETAQVEPLKTYTIEEFLETTSVGGGDFNADETRLLVHSNKTGIYNVYSIDIATGEMTQLTDSQDTTFSVAYMPDGNGFFFTRDAGGNELYKLFLQDESGEVTQLTQGENTREMFYGYAHDRKSFFTGNNSRDPKYFDVYEWPLDTLEPAMFYQNDSGRNLAAISEDKRWVALSETHNDFDSDMYLIDREGDGEPVLISEHEGEINFFPQTFTPDSSKLLYTTDGGSDFLYLMSYDLETGEREEVMRPDKWGVFGVGFSHNGTYRVIYVNVNSVPELHITNLETGEEVEIQNKPEGTISGVDFSLSEKLMTFYVVNADMPSNLYVYNMDDESVTQLTDNLNPAIDSEYLVEPKLISMTARDGLEFYGYLYKPIQASADEPVPALLWIHGGPGGQSRPTWSAEKQFMVNHGYAIFDLNYRGSSGFGREFSMADDQKHGHEPLYDCIDAKNWLVENVDWIDPEKIGILGGSYGGYMVMAALAFQPEEFVVGIDIFGVTNWVRTLKSIPPYWESFRLSLYREIGNPETQEQMLYDISPLFHAENITKPVLVLQGKNDPRVLQVESDEMVENIRSAGGTAEYIVFDDEGHGFTKTENRIAGWSAILDFCDTYMKGKVEPMEEEPEGEGAEETPAN